MNMYNVGCTEWRHKWHKEVSLTTLRSSKTLMPSDKILRSGYMGFHVLTGISTHPSSALHMERSVEIVAKTIISRWYAGPGGGNM